MKQPRHEDADVQETGRRFVEAWTRLQQCVVDWSAAGIGNETVGRVFESAADDTLRFMSEKYGGLCPRAVAGTAYTRGFRDACALAAAGFDVSALVTIQERR